MNILQISSCLQDAAVGKQSTADRDQRETNQFEEEFRFLSSMLHNQLKHIKYAVFIYPHCYYSRVRAVSSCSVDLTEHSRELRALWYLFVGERQETDFSHARTLT